MTTPKYTSKFTGRTRIRTFAVWSLDVWGNRRDGYEVNDRGRVGKLEVEEREIAHNAGTSHEFKKFNAEDDDVVRALKDQGYIKKTVRKARIEIEDDGEGLIYVNDAKDGKPIFQLEAESARENPLVPGSKRQGEMGAVHYVDWHGYTIYHQYDHTAEKWASWIGRNDKDIYVSRSKDGAIGKAKRAIEDGTHRENPLGVRYDVEHREAGKEWRSVRTFENESDARHWAGNYFAWKTGSWRIRPVAYNPLSQNAKLAIGLAAGAAVVGTIVFLATRKPAEAATNQLPPGQTTANPLIIDQPSVIAAQIALARFMRGDPSIGTYTVATPNGNPNDPTFKVALQTFQVYANKKGGVKQNGATTDQLRVDGVLDTDTMKVLVAMLAKQGQVTSTQPGSSLPQVQVVSYQKGVETIPITVTSDATGATATFAYPLGSPPSSVTGSDANDAIARAKQKIDTTIIPIGGGINVGP